MGNGYLDSVLGVEEGGSAGVGLLAALKGAGIATGPYAPYILGGSVGLNVLGKFLGGVADRPAERMQARLGSQQLELNSLQIAAVKKQQAEERAQKRKQMAWNGALGKIFSNYKAMAGGGA